MKSISLAEHGAVAFGAWRYMSSFFELNSVTATLAGQRAGGSHLPGFVSQLIPGFVTQVVQRIAG